jgi:signal transduction histidine kinase
MSPETFTANSRHRRRLYTRLTVPVSDGATGPVAGWTRRTWNSIPLAGRLSGTALVGAAAATTVGYVTWKNPFAAPQGVAVVFRVLIIVTLIAAGVYAQTSDLQARMGGLLIAVGLYSSLWLLNGSGDRFPFSVGVLFTALAPALFAYLMLAHPTGHIRHLATQRFLAWTGGSLALLWLLAVGMVSQPPLKTPLLQCHPHCPDNVFSFGSATDLWVILRAAIVAAWIALTAGVPVLLTRRMRAASAPTRLSIAPVWAMAVATALLVIAYIVLLAAGSSATATVGAVYIAAAFATPLAILLGLGMERMFMGRALAEFVNALARLPTSDPEALMARALRDPSLKIAYQRRGVDDCVDADGNAVEMLPANSAVTWIERDRRAIAAVLYNSDLVDQERFVHAAGAAALLRLEQTQLQADLRASLTDLAESRVRMMENAYAERRRLERDLHDGVQQQLVGLRLKLELATEKVKVDPEQGQRALAAVGEQIDDVLASLRSVARGIYPSLLHEHGLEDALKSAARRVPVPIRVRAEGVGRYHEDVEVAVYFCCLEALQNIVKHAEGDAGGTLTLRDEGTRLYFEVRDDGIGFDAAAVHGGHGLTNMRDRIQAVGGTLTVTSRRQHGTSVWGRVPVGGSD